MNKKKPGQSLLGRALTAAFEKVGKVSFCKLSHSEEQKAEREAEQKVQSVLKNAPRNRDVSKDRFIHRKIGRIPVFTVKRRSIGQLNKIIGGEL